MPRYSYVFVTGLVWALSCMGSAAQDDADKTEPDYTPVTVSDPEVPLDELDLLLKPLTVDELQGEATAWMELLREKTRQTSQAELAIKQKRN